MKSNEDYNPMRYSSCHIRELRSIIMYELGRNIRRIRISHGETLKTLADALNLSKSTLSKYENGEIEYPSSLLPLIAGRYNVTISELYDEQILPNSHLQNELFNKLIYHKLNELDDFTLDYAYYNNILASYLKKYMSLEKPNSFDLYYTFSSFLEALEIISQNKEISDINQERLGDVFLSFFENISKIKNNDYKTNHSVFLKKLLPDVSDEAHTSWLEFERWYFRNQEDGI